MDIWGPIIFIGGILIIGTIIALVIAVATRSKPEPKRTISLPKVPISRFSQIDLAAFVTERVIPEVPEHTARTDDMEWELFLVEDAQSEKSVVELYLAFSDNAIDVIQYWALNAEPLKTEKMFDEDSLENVQAAQEQEILEAGEDRERIAGLKIDHQNQIRHIQNLPWGRTIESYRQWPYRREFDTRIEARWYYDKLDEDYLPAFKQKLERYAKRKRGMVSGRSAPANDTGENSGVAGQTAD